MPWICCIIMEAKNLMLVFFLYTLQKMYVIECNSWKTGISLCLFFTSCTRWRTFSVVVGSDEQLLAFYLAVHNGLSKKKFSLSSSRRKKTSLSRVWMWVRSSVITSDLSFSELLLPKLLLLLLANLCLISLTIWDFKC